MTKRELPENVLKIEQRSWAWNGVTVVDVHEYTKGEVIHSLVNKTETGLAIALEEVGGVTEPRLKPNQACTVDYRPNHMALVPKGMDLWGHATKELHYSRYAVLLFDLDHLADAFGEVFKPRAFEIPRLRYVNPKIHTLIKMLTELPQDDGSSRLLGDSLTSAIFAILSAPEAEAPKAGKLADAQLRLVIDYIGDQLPRQVELRELADLVGQSQWHFCRAFKLTTGLSPYQWQLEQRIAKVRHLLLQSDAPLETIAAMTGFGDAMHLIRVFRQKAGQTPGVWRRQHAGHS